MTCATAFAQPGQLGTQTFNGAYVSYGLTDLGIFRQARVQASTSAAASTRNWEFYEASLDYDPAWRPYVCCPTLAAYNQTIAPVGGTASAVFNTGFGGIAGFMQAITADNYYTFNVTEYSKPGVPANEFMGVLETSYLPVSITSVTQSPLAGAVYPENSVYVTVTTSASLSANEYVYLRYASTYNFTTSTLLSVTMTGTTGTVEIPCAAAGDSVYYYVYSSNRTSATILAEVTALGVDGEVVHDMSTLSINNNGGPNYSYEVLPSVGFCGDYYVPSVCYPTVASFVTALNAGTVSCDVVCNVAAGHTETAPVGGINLTQTGTAANTITFVKDGAGANPIIYAPVGTVTLSSLSSVVDGIFSLNGSDYITIDGIDLTDNNASAPATMEFGYGLFKSGATDGCRYNTIQNCSITLKSTNTSTSAPLNFEFGSRGITMHNSTRTVLGTMLTISTAGGRNDNNTFRGNTISNVFNGIVITGYQDGTSPYTYYDQDNVIGESGAGNIIEHYGGSSTVRCAGIYTKFQNNITVSYNELNNTAGGGTAHTNTLYGINIASSGSSNFNATVSHNIIQITQGAASSSVYCIRTGANYGETAGDITIEYNTIQNSGFAAGANGAFTGIDQVLNAANAKIEYNELYDNTLTTTSTAAQYMINNNTESTNSYIQFNTITNNSKTAAVSGTFYGIYNNCVPTSAITYTINNNTIDGLSVNSGAAGSAIGIRSTSNSFNVQQVINNSISNITGGSGTSVWTVGVLVDGMPSGSIVANNYVTGITSTAHCVGINCAAVATLGTSANLNFSIYDNYVSAISSSGNTSTVAGIGMFASTAIDCYDNVVDGVSSSGTTSPVVRGISIGGGSSGNSLNVYNCEVSNINHSGAAGVVYPAGIYLFPTSATVNVYNNHVFDVSGNSVNEQVIGIYATSGSVTYNIYNNFLQRFTAPNSTGYYAVNGIYVAAGGSTYNISYNTIALGEDAVLTGAGDFGVCGMYHGAGLMNLRNNIIYINATTSGNGVASCIRKGTTGVAGTPPGTTSISASTNNNYYYINTASNNYIYVEGAITTTIKNGYAWAGATTSVVNNLNNDPCFNVKTDGDITSYKYFMSLSGGGTRELNSYYDVPPFAGGAVLPDNLKLTPGAVTYAESGAVVIAGITTDYEGDTRSGTTPDIGADEGGFVVQTASCTLLPVELVSFTGWYNGIENELHWTTATEINSSYFEVQKSLDGIDFIPIGAVDAAGNSLIELNYIFYDDDPTPGINYYRLRMVDMDGSFEFSNTIAIRVDADGVPAFTLFPNPAQNVIGFAITTNTDSKVVVEICDVPGRNVIRKQFELHKGQNTYQLDISHLAAAAYFIYFVNADGEKQVLKFVKE